jgi:hypothetical protein
MRLFRRLRSWLKVCSYLCLHFEFVQDFFFFSSLSLFFYFFFCFLFFVKHICLPYRSYSSLKHSQSANAMHHQKFDLFHPLSLSIKGIIMCLQWQFLNFWKISYSRWDFILDWTLSWRMACTCLHGRIWTVPYFLVIDSWNPPSVSYQILIMLLLIYNELSYTIIIQLGWHNSVNQHFF